VRTMLAERVQTMNPVQGGPASLKVHDKMLAWLTTGWAALDGIHRLHAFGQHRPHGAR
jgi:hypothetical protein